MERTAYRHVVVDETGEAFVEGTKICVARIANNLNFGEVLDGKIEELCRNYGPGYLTPAKIYSALAYAHDNREEIMKDLSGSPPPGFKKDEKGNWAYKRDE